MSRPRLVDIAAFLLSVVVIVGIVVALRPAATPTITANPAAIRVDRHYVPSADTRPSVLFIGDSYTSGNGLTEMSYGCMAALRLGWLCQLSAVPGTGFISGGAANRFDLPHRGPSKSYVERIPGLALIYQPDVVVIDGGRNDRFPPRDSVFRAMAGTTGEARRAWPDATIVFIRPRFLDRPSDDLGFDNDFFANLKEQPSVEGVMFVDPIGTLTETDTSTMLRSDGIHPNHRGDQVLSDLLYDMLLASGFAVSI